MVGVFALGALASCTDEAARQNPTEIDVVPQFATPIDLQDLTTTFPVDVNGAWWIPAVSYKVGSGVLNPFLDWKAPGNDTDEEGFNTDGDFNYDQHRKVDTNPLPLNIIPTIRYEGDDELYREIILDVNESNDVPAAQMSFEDFQLYLCDDPGAPTYGEYSDFVGGANGCDLIYDIYNPAYYGLGTTDEYTSGSGSDLDYVVLIPEGAFAGSSVDISGCTYNPVASPCGVWVILKLHTGGYGGEWIAEGGYEEAASIIRPWVEVTKTANPTYTLTYDWMVTKVADETLHQLEPGGEATTNYTITVDLDGDPVPSNWAVTGDINIYNPSDGDVLVTSVADAIEGFGGEVTISCPEGPPFTVPSGETVTCTYGAAALPNGDTRLNTATVEIETGGVFLGTESIDFAANGEVTERINATVDVYDTYEDEDPAFLGTVAYDDPLPAIFDDLSRTWTFTVAEQEAVCKLHPNLAEVFGDDDVLLDSDDEEVLIQCTNLDVAKDVYTRVLWTWDWTITKEVTPTPLNLFVGESQESQYTVTVEKVDYAISGWEASGTITIENTGTTDAEIASVEDWMDGIEATVTDCDPVEGSTLAPGETMTCEYSTALENGNTLDNVATACVTDNGCFSSDPVEVSFGTPDQVDELYPTAVFDDTNGESWGPVGDGDPAGTTYPETYTRWFECGESDTYPNTAYVYGVPDEGDNVELDSDGAEVVVNCYDLDVAKTADEFFDRVWTWDIEKDFTDDFFSNTSNLDCVGPDADNDYVCTAHLGAGGILTVEYEVTVYADAVENNWQVKGDITITNNHPSRAAELTDVSDAIDGYGGAIGVDCQGATEVPAGGSIVCSYDTGPVDSPDDNPFGDLNTATATQQLCDFPFDADPVCDAAHTMDYTATWPVDFGEAEVTITDECVDVDDMLEGFDVTPFDFGNICATSDPFEHTFDPYLREFAAPDECDKTFINTATVYNEDGVALAEDQEEIDIECEFGCTLTQGYYKTHSSYGPAPYDPILWGLVYPPDPFLEADELLFDSGMTWYEVFWTSPSGGNLWIKLAHQWMAAWINQQANGGSPVDAQIAQAATILENFSTQADIPKDDPIWSTANDLHSDLAAYNEGNAGVEHCTEASYLWYMLLYGG